MAAFMQGSAWLGIPAEPGDGPNGHPFLDGLLDGSRHTVALIT